jgi:hypothetical protein
MQEANQEAHVSLLDGRLLSEGLGLVKADVCVICGIVLDASMDRRSHTVRTIQLNLEQSWLPTSYSWGCVSALCSSSDPNHRLSTCGGCTNWLRRCNRFLPARETETREPEADTYNVPKKFLPIDELVAFSLAPGEVQVPDLRNMRRLYHGLVTVSSITRDGVTHTFRNFYHSLLPAHLRECFGELQALPGGWDDGVILRSIVQHWWRANNHTEFFRSLKTSCLLRRFRDRQEEGREGP